MGCSARANRRYFKPGILGGGAITEAPSEETRAIGSIIAFWDGHQFGEYDNREGFLQNVRERRTLSNRAGDFDCFELYEVIGEPEGRIVYGRDGGFDEKGNRVVFGDAVKPIKIEIPEEIRKARP